MQEERPTSDSAPRPESESAPAPEAQNELPPAHPPALDPAVPQPARPEPPYDFHDPEVVAALFHLAAELNLSSPLRKGGMVELPARGRVVMTGDVHDHSINLMRILKVADLESRPEHHVIIHEVIHGPYFVNGRDMSVRILAKVAGLKVDYPGQVHFLQSNHELCQYLGHGITKNNVNVIEVFDEGLDFLYGDEADTVRTAMKAFIRSYPIAVRCPRNVVCVHSLPSLHHMGTFDLNVLQRVPTEDDLQPTGSVYRMVWGRTHTAEMMATFREAWMADVFVMGHQMVESGMEALGESILILASDHPQGVALPIELGRHYDLDMLAAGVVPLAAVTLGAESGNHMR